MGFYVHIHVAFACDTNDGVAALARKHLPNISEVDERFPNGSREARWFLTDLASRMGGNKGPKGGLSLWGIVGNYTSPVQFAEVLRPFWSDLLTRDLVEGGPLSFERVVILYEYEQIEEAGAVEVWRNEETGVVEIRHHEHLPFSWRQM